MVKTAPLMCLILLLILVTSIWFLDAKQVQAQQDATATAAENAVSTTPGPESTATNDASLATALPAQPTEGPVGQTTDSPVPTNVQATLAPNQETATATPTIFSTPTQESATPTPSNTTESTPVPPTAVPTTSAVPTSALPISPTLLNPVEAAETPAPATVPTQSPNPGGAPTSLPSTIQAGEDANPNSGLPLLNDPIPWVIIGILALLFFLILGWAFQLWRSGKQAVNKGASNLQSETGRINSPVPQTAQLSGPAFASPLLLHDRTLLGRGESMDSKFGADVPGLASVDLEHARITRRNNRWLLQDGIEEGRQSERGVYVNGKRTRVNYLQDGDTVRLGEVELTFHESPQGDQK